MHPTDSVRHDLCPSDINPSSNVGSQTLRSDGVGENAPLDASLTNWSHHIHLLHTHTYTHTLCGSDSGNKKYKRKTAVTLKE